MLPLASALHLLSAVIWVGGMFFAYMILRPISTRQFEPPQRLKLWSTVFALFFPWVWAAIVVLTSTGLWLIFHQFGGMKNIGLHIHIMLSISLLMSLIFAYLFFLPYRQLSGSVSKQNWPEAAKAMSQIRTLMAVNLSLGLSVIVIAATGSHLFT